MRKLPSCLAGLDDAVKKNLSDWRAHGKVRRLWQHDASLWTNEDECSWLGWLNIVNDQLANVSKLNEFANEVKAAGFSDILLLGMGGSSLCPEVFALTFPQAPGFPRLHILDSTDPAQIRSVESKIDLAKTLFIVSSKSGSTLEPNIYKQYFFERVQQTIGDKAASHFIAITDPGSKMQGVAERDRFWHIFYGLPSIGGRYSALSNFGMVPAAAMGMDTGKFLERTKKMVDACVAAVPIARKSRSDARHHPGHGQYARPRQNHAHHLARHSRPGCVARTTDRRIHRQNRQGHHSGRSRERWARPEFTETTASSPTFALTADSDSDQDAKVAALEKAGQPVVRITVSDIYNLGQEFFRWEIATAVAGSIIGINAFNQPDVEASKIETKKLTTEYEAKGSLPAETPILEEAGFKLFTDEKNAADLATAVGSDRSLKNYLRAHLGRIKEGDYFAVLAYVRDERRARRTPARAAYECARQQTCSDLPRLRPALPALDGASV